MASWLKEAQIMQISYLFTPPAGKLITRLAKMGWSKEQLIK